MVRSPSVLEIEGVVLPHLWTDLQDTYTRAELNANWLWDHRIGEMAIQTSSLMLT
jgi:hypothetical protein